MTQPLLYIRRDQIVIHHKQAGLERGEKAAHTHTHTHANTHLRDKGSFRLLLTGDKASTENGQKKSVKFLNVAVNRVFITENGHRVCVRAFMSSGKVM